MSQYTAFTDGGRRKAGAVCAFIVFASDSHYEANVLQQFGTFLGEGTNNFAEYMGLIHLLEYCKDNFLTGVRVFSDSQLMVRQINGIYTVKSQELLPLWARASVLADLVKAQLIWVPREQNEVANSLVDAVYKALP